MGVTELTAMIMPAITGLTGGVGTGLGTAAAEEVRRLMRERLGASEEGRAALARLDEEHPPPEAEDGVRTQVAAVLASDPEFAREVQQAAQQAEITAGGNVNTISIGGGVKGSTITIGPVTLQKTPGVQASLVALTIAVVVLLAFGTYGVVQTLRSDNSPAASPGAGVRDGVAEGTGAPNGQGETEKKLVAAVKDADRFRAIFPDVQSMPSGWSPSESDSVTNSTSSCSENCKGKIHSGAFLFANSDIQSMFRASGYDSAETAAAGYISLVKATQELPDTNPMSLAPVGDESTAFSVVENTGSEHIYTMAVVVRVGTVVARVDYGNSYEPLDPSALLALTEMIAERAQQAQNGDAPSATARQ
ncbi:hypothetical protein [Streptomyces sp. NPDC056194]|uniref:hypothetical protein n=1 Tax=unclassified Streptomyces TaxID=2593676 RepID=UPI0035DB59BF